MSLCPFPPWVRWKMIGLFFIINNECLSCWQSLLSSKKPWTLIFVIQDFCSHGNQPQGSHMRNLTPSFYNSSRYIPFVVFFFKSPSIFFCNLHLVPWQTDWGKHALIAWHEKRLLVISKTQQWTKRSEVIFLCIIIPRSYTPLALLTVFRNPSNSSCQLLLCLCVCIYIDTHTQTYTQYNYKHLKEMIPGDTYLHIYILLLFIT